MVVLSDHQHLKVHKDEYQWDGTMEHQRSCLPYSASHLRPGRLDPQGCFIRGLHPPCLHPCHSKGDGVDPILSPGPEHNVLMSHDVFAEHIEDKSSSEDSCDEDEFLVTSPLSFDQFSVVSAHFTFSTPLSHPASGTHSPSSLGTGHGTPTHEDTSNSPRRGKGWPLHFRGRTAAFAHQPGRHLQYWMPWHHPVLNQFVWEPGESPWRCWLSQGSGSKRSAID